MNTSLRRRVALVGGLAALSLVAAACGSDSDTSSGAATTAAGGAATTAASGATTTAAGGAPTTAATGGLPAECQEAKATLNASGATFPQAFYEEAIAAFKEEVPGVTINYGGGGSGKGRQDLADQVTDWAGSDSAIKEEDLAKFKGGEVLYFPTVLAPITLAYNLDGVDKLQLSPATVAKIFQLEITTWNDPAIAADNPGVTLPDEKITVAVRSDSSGTTDNFTKFLDASVGSKGDGTWKLKSGSTIEWPAGVQAGNGNAGVSQIVKDTPGAMGYVDLADAKASDLSTASVKNKAGKFVEPTLEATSAAAEGAEIKDNLTFFAGWAEGDASYPIAAQTWILAYAIQTDAAKSLATRCFINYVLTAGQELAGEVDYARLPANLDEKALAQLDKIQG